jgi:colanic acid biosynthesis glycosyl transferase WcaI
VNLDMPPMKVTILSLNYFPELTGIGVYNHDFAESLADESHEVTVVCTYPYYPQWRRDRRYSANLYSQEQVGRVKVVRCLTYVPKRPTSLRRIIHEGFFSLLAFAWLLFSDRPDVLLAVSPPFLGMLAAACLSRIRRIPLHIHIQDLQPDTAIDLGMLEGRALIRVLHGLEAFSYRTAASISCIGQGMLEKVRSKGMPADKTLLFRNWVNFDFATRTGECNSRTARKGLFLDGKYIVLHAGNMGKKQALDILLETAALSQKSKDDIVFLLVGDGVMRSGLEQKAAREGLRNVLFLDVQPKEQFLDILYSADISVVLQRVQVRDIVVPSKIANILAAGSPIIASVHRESETASVLRGLSIEVIVEPEDPEALYRKIIEYKNKNSASMQRLREEEYSLARRHFSREQVIPPIIDHLKKLAGMPE